MYIEWSGTAPIRGATEFLTASASSSIPVETRQGSTVGPGVGGSSNGGVRSHRGTPTPYLVGRSSIINHP